MPPLSLALGLGLTDGGRPAYSPLADPAGLEWWDPTTLTAGVVASWVGRLRAAALAAAGGARPTYSATGIGGAFPGVGFDGVANILSTAALGPVISGLGGLTLICAAVDTATTVSSVVEYSANPNTNTGGFGFVVNDGAVDLEALALNGTVAITRDLTETLAAVRVVSIGFDYTGVNAAVFIRVNGAATSLTQAATKTALGTLGNFSLFVGARSGAGLPWAGTLGDLFLRSGTTQDATLAAAERFVGARVGLSF